MGLFKPKLAPGVKAKMERPGVRAFVSVPCSSGLPVAEGTFCQIYYFDEFLEIVAAGVEYTLKMGQIHDISIQTKSAVQSQFVSSTGGAVLGAAIAGPVGAAIGGRAKKKEVRTVALYLTISYTNKDGNITYIAFDASHTPKCREMESLFRKRAPKSGQIEL
ncbi:MAG: hypothetical protein K2M42_12220 [Oscillospiraceae bacterium]|nr:hypothetical protein [Oscillospiraceae bacterium]